MRDHGFTLIELLVVIVILGILAGVVVFAVRGSGDKGYAAAEATDKRILRTALEAYCARYGSYPSMQDDEEIPGSDDAMDKLVYRKFLSDRSRYHTLSTGSTGEGNCNNTRYTIDPDRPPDDPVPPVSPVALSGVIAAGEFHSLALASDGVVWAWGDNSYGQLGNGTKFNASIPVPVSGLPAVKAIAAGWSHSLALDEAGKVWAWGFNASGQVGNGTTTDSSNPVAVNGLSGVTAIAGGAAHSLALKNDGAVWAWGSNRAGQLGNGTTTTTGCSCISTPGKVSELSDVAVIAAGSRHSLGLHSDGTVSAWGRNDAGQLGNGTTTTTLCFCIPIPAKVKVSDVNDLSDITAIAGGGAHSLALKNDGTAQAWGSNSAGQLGNGTTDASSLPVPVSELSNVTAIAAGLQHSLARRNGTVWAWGFNGSGQLGNGTTTNSSHAVTVEGDLSGITAIAAGGHSLAAGSDGTVWAWGSNGSGQLGNMCACSSSPRPLPVVRLWGNLG